MDGVRDEIISYLDKPGTSGHYKQLKDCLVLQPGTETTDGGIVDEWFKGVIESLYYRPNKYVLVLEGKQNIGKTEFFIRLFPERKPYQELSFGYCEDMYSRMPYHEDSSENIYTHLIINLIFNKNLLNLPLEDNFRIIQREAAVCDKRLSSYCCTTNKWQFPKRKNYIVLRLKSIDLQRYNSIDKTELWIEIFNKFKPK